MKPSNIWIDEIPHRNGNKCVVNSLAFRPDGSQLVAAADTRVLIYDAEDGALIKSLKAHKDVVYTVSYSRNGKIFASGGADNTVIIWSFKGEGVLKYTHNDSIQCLAYNPVTQVLASCTNSDFGIWSPEQKSVNKTKVISKILCASWTNDGQKLALGMLNGHLSIRDSDGNETVLIEKTAPVWSVSWNPSKKEAFDVLAVGCWDKTLSFYQVDGTQHGKDRKLTFNPCSVSYFNDGKYLLVGGSHNEAGLYTKEGTFLSSIYKTPGWVWSAQARPKHDCVAVGSDDGSVVMQQLNFGTAHGIYQERYAYRENLTDVIIQHLMTEQKVRIRTRDLVKKVAVYRNRLAVQLSDRVIIYELTHENSHDMHYRVKERITQSLDCNLLVVTSLHFVLCQETKLQQYNFSGKKEREWVLESPIRYIKVVGGAKGREGLIVGLKSGEVLQIFLNNPFTIPLLKQSATVRCVDLNANRTKLAVVDDTSTCYVYDLETKELLFQEPDAQSVAWNTESSDMLCFSGKGQLKIKTGNFPVHTQRLQGFVVGFSGSKVFCLYNSQVQTIDVPQSAPLYRYIEEKNFDAAYQVACLGVTESDWRLLGMESLKVMDLELARKAFIRVRDMRYIELITHLESQRKTNNSVNENVFLAELQAYEGKFIEASKTFAKCNKSDMALSMFTDLRMWDEAKAFAAENGTVDATDLVTRQAEWAEEVQDWRAAAEMHFASGNYVKAIKIIGDRKWFGELSEVARKLDPLKESEALNLCAKYLYEAREFKLCRDVYLKIGNIEDLLKLYVELGEWDEAIKLEKTHGGGKYSAELYLPYAEWLTSVDRFDDALDAYYVAGRADKTTSMLQDLATNAVIEHRFKDAAYYHFRLSTQYMEMLDDDDDKDVTVISRTDIVNRIKEHSKHSDLYYAYDLIHSYSSEPITTASPESLFHASRFIINVVGKEEAPIGISKAKTFYTLGKQSVFLEAFKLARFAFEKLQGLHVPTKWADQIDFSIMTLQTKPFSDRDELLPVDYRSSSTNPLLNTTGTGDVCVNSRHPFVRSFATFENLPLVEFQPAEGISDEDAMKLIEALPDNYNEKTTSSDGWKETDHGSGVQTMQFGEESMDEEALMMNDDNNNTSGDAFERQLSRQASKCTSQSYTPLLLDAASLTSLVPSEVFVLTYPSAAIRHKYYKNMIPEIKLKCCSHCRKFFNQEDYDFESLKNNGSCPFCRRKSDESCTTNNQEDNTAATTTVAP